MATINTNDLRIQNARNFVRTLTEEETNSFIFVGGVTPWENEEQPPTPVNNFKEIYKSHDEMLALSAIREGDVFHMVPKVRWTSGIIYDYYRHDYSPELTSNQGANNLYNSIYYVINQNNDVYVCLFNDYNTPSTVEPQNDTNEPFFTSDGYQWLRMYNISDYYIKNRTTQNFMPIIFQDSNTRLEEGAVYTVVVDSPGSNYTRSASGKSNLIRYYYCNVVGDGEGAVARIIIDNGSVIRVDIVRPGRGYTYATVDFVANRTYASLFDLDNQIDGLNPKGDGTFSSTVIISPPGGWGSDLVRQFGSTRVAVFSELEFDFDELLPDTKFRQIGILHDPETQQENPSTMIGCFGVKVNVIDDNNEFKYGEVIEQNILTRDEVGNIIKTNIAKAKVVGWDPDLGLLRYVQIPEEHTDADGRVYGLQGVEDIRGVESGKTAIPDTTFNGSFKGALFSEGYAIPEYTKYTGLTLYLTNISPVVRQETQTEKISLVVTY
jgi:hypothetical protein